MRENRIKKAIFVIILMTISTFSQTWKDDSLVVRQILDTNGLYNLTVDSVVKYKDTSGRATFLWFKDLPTFHILPASINKLNKLGELMIQRTGCASLPAEIGDLKSLGTLCITYNKLTSLPPEIGGLSKLVSFVIGNEKEIKTIPSEIGKLSLLKIIRISSCSLLELPDEICNLTRLEELTLHNNKLTGIPDSIGNLSSLGGINLDFNNLKSLPNSVVFLPFKQIYFRVCYNDSLVFTPEQCSWLMVKDYDDYFRKYCPVDIEEEQALQPLKGILTHIVAKNNSIQFNLRLSTDLDIRLYDMHGRKIAKLFSGLKKAGTHSVVINKGEYGAGVLYLTIRAGQECHRKAIVMLQ